MLRRRLSLPQQLQRLVPSHLGAPAHGQGQHQGVLRQRRESRAFCDSGLRPFASFQLFHDELSSTRPWVSMHVSDHSGFHYRQFLLRELMTELRQVPSPSSSSSSSSSQSSSTQPASPEANGELAGAEAEAQSTPTTLLRLFHQELELCSDLIQSFPGHETLWSHR